VQTIYQSDTFRLFSSPKSHQEIAKRLCQHVVGMNPLTLGDFDDEVTKREIRDDWVDVEVKEGEDETMVSPDKLMPVHEKDSRFLFQEFILDPSLTVKEVVVANGIQILDFVRYQSGEELS
jgi:elongation factor Ts